MLKGLYFMGWQRDMWNYHPSLPMKNLQMVEDIKSMQVDMLTWSCLGSGAIGLPYLDKEAFDEIPARLRLYGYMNDSEFCAACRDIGVKVFAVLWKAQLWEFGAELNDDESELLSLNLLRGASDNHQYIGMRELSTNRFPKLFDPIEKYFPDGLEDYRGEKIDDFLDAFKAVSLEKRDILSAWLMAPEHDHKCYTPCCNKSSYLAYMKRNTELMVDAGAGGLHIDEYDTQKHVLHNAGCFCDECMHKFRNYLSKNHIPLPIDAAVESVSAFDYRQYLLSKQITDENLLAFNGNDRWQIPLYRHFVDMQMESVEWVVKELSQHVKAYAKSKQIENFPVSANFFQCFPIAWNCKKHVDVLSGEKTDIRLRQDGWYKFAFGWKNGKESCFVEDPNQYVRDMQEDIKNGINDRFILFILEPMAHGFHIAFPYGSWLQNQVKDAFWPDLRLMRQLGPWLKTNDRLFSQKPIADIGVLYDLPSAYENMWTEPGQNTRSTYGKVQKIDLTGITELGRQGSFANDGDFSVFFNLIQQLSEQHVLYNVIYESPDEPLTLNNIEKYKTIVVPDAFLMDEKTASVLNNYQKQGGKLITIGRYVETLAPDRQYETVQQNVLAEYLKTFNQIVTTDGSKRYGYSLQALDKGYALHIVNYQYNEDTHLIDPLQEIKLTLDLPFKQVLNYSFPENPMLSVDFKPESKEISIRQAGIYTILEIIN